MKNPNTTMEEYIKLEEEKARRRGKVYNWETARYGRIWYDDDVRDLRSEKIGLQERIRRIRFKGLEYTNAEIADFEIRLGKINSREVHWVLVLDFESFLAKMVEGLTGRMLMEHRDTQGQKEMQSVGFGLYWTESARKISDKEDLSAYWRGISFEGDFL
nr:hypothetical protein [Tanacetum cinerariifolium]